MVATGGGIGALLVPKPNHALAQVIRADRNGDTIAEHDADAESTQLARKLGVNRGSRLCLYQERPAGEHFLDHAVNLDQVVTRQRHLTPGAG